LLAEAAGVSVEQVRQYQRQGLIPYHREWQTKGPAMFYRSDVDKIEDIQRKKKTPDARQ
jgi:DNA-binding transcriptional MerR regulator